MKKRLGFTLIELLVVIAIITILAAIAVPAVSSYLSRAQARATFAEVRQIETAMTAMLADIGRKDFNALFTQAVAPNVDLSNPNAVLAAANIYSDIFYRLLRQGRNATDLRAGVNMELVRKMGTSYMDIDTDPYGSQYRFFIGPVSNAAVMPFRSYRLDRINPVLDGLRQPREYNASEKAQLEQETVPGQPRADNGLGIPASRELTFYIWSRGGNLVDDQGFYIRGSNIDKIETAGGGDDINNWDGSSSGQGWMVWY